jgi:hypothetical protein
LNSRFFNSFQMIKFIFNCNFLIKYFSKLIFDEVEFIFSFLLVSYSIFKLILAIYCLKLIFWWTFYLIDLVVFFCFEFDNLSIKYFNFLIFSLKLLIHQLNLTFKFLYLQEEILVCFFQTNFLFLQCVYFKLLIKYFSS